MGGRYIKKWTDEADGGAQRYTAAPSEVSLVDNPCVKTALFQVAKADGTVEDRAFKLWSPTDQEVIAAAQEMAKADGSDWGTHMEPAREALLKAYAEQVVEEGAEEVPEEVPIEGADKAGNAIDLVKQVWTSTDGKTFEKKADAVAHEATLTANKTVADNPLAKALARAQEVSGIVPAEGDVVKFEPTPNLAAFGAALEKVQELQGELLAKGFYEVGWLARIISEVVCLQSCCTSEEQYEGNGGDSPIPAALATATQTLGNTLIQMAQEELAEALQFMKERGTDFEMIVVEGDVIIEAAAQAIDLVKGNADLMEKAGARHSKGDMEKLQGIHDHAAKLGAKCDSGNCDTDKGATGDIEKDDTPQGEIAVLKAANAALEQQQKDAAVQVEAITSSMEELKKQIAELSAQPGPSAPRGNVVGKDGVVSQATSTAQQAEELLKLVDPEALAVAAIKMSHQSGGGTPVYK
jgi:hypothetical protein